MIVALGWMGNQFTDKIHLCSINKYDWVFFECGMRNVRVWKWHLIPEAKCTDGRRCKHCEKKANRNDNLCLTNRGVMGCDYAPAPQVNTGLQPADQKPLTSESRQSRIVQRGHANGQTIAIDKNSQR
jgi:hypothetical protein